MTAPLGTAAPRLQLLPHPPAQPPQMIFVPSAHLIQLEQTLTQISNALQLGTGTMLSIARSLTEAGRGVHDAVEVLNRALGRP